MQRENFLKYKDFLSEKIDMTRVAWHRKSSYFAARGYLPITQKIAKEFYDQRIQCFHMTGISELDNFKHLIGKKKTLSAFTKMVSDKLLGRIGIQTRFDVLFYIDGEILINSNYDVMSAPDEQGRRWISVYYLEEERSPKFIQDYKNLLSNVDNKFGKEFTMNLINPDQTTENKAKADFISFWVTEAEKFVIKHKEEILLSLSRKARSPWNELLVNNIKIKDAVLIYDDEYYIQNYANNLFGSIENLEKELKALVSGEIWITKQRKDVIEFIEKRGGKVT